MRSRNQQAQRIATQLKRDTVLELAVWSLINCNDLRESAFALADKGRHGIARSLAISAMEDLGKFILALRYLTGC